MTVADLKKKLEGLNNNAKVLVEEKISGKEYSFEMLADTYIQDGNLVIYML